MKIFGMGVPELVIILIVALLIFGPKNLPKLGSALGKTVKNLREGMGTADGSDDLEDEDIVEEVETVEEVVEEAEGPFSDPDAPKKTTKKATVKKKAE